LQRAELLFQLRLPVRRRVTLLTKQLDAGTKHQKRTVQANVNGKLCSAKPMGCCLWVAIKDTFC